MPRRNSRETPPAVKVKEERNIITEIRKYRVITPLYGGGVEPEHYDPITVVRASEIRGHLRFWWRATRGGAYNGNLQDMREDEEKVWGSAGGEGKAGMSQVALWVSPLQRGKTRSNAKDRKGRLVDYGDIKSPYGYVAFPLRRTADKPAGSVQEDVSFELELRYPEGMKDDVLTALWAWETFGGIGARTRRGFGALRLVSVNGQAAPALPKTKCLAYLKNKLSGIEGLWPPGVPHLSPHSRFVLLDHNYRQPLEAWENLFTKLQRFRQQSARYDRRTGQKKAFGLSTWPEANAIRHFLRLRPRFPANFPQNVITKFPRAVFGLPIGFEMHHDGDQRLELQGADTERLASPLILRPLACTDGAVGLALVLEWEPIRTPEPYTPPGGLRLTGEEGNFPVHSQLTPQEAQRIPILDGNPDVLLQFLNFLKNGR